MDRKVIIITGSRKGIGRHLAEYYLRKGHVVAGCSRGESDLRHRAYTHYEVDVADEAAVKSMIFDVAKRESRIDILINNAGVTSMNHSLLTPLDSFETIFKTNLYGTFLFSREAAKVMARKRFGRIVNFSSIAVPLRLDGEAAYASSKAAVESFTRILAKEIGGMNVTCNAIGASPIKTDMTKDFPKDTMDAVIKRQTIRRFGKFSDVANAVDFFIKPESDFITGQVIYLGGIC